MKAFYPSTTNQIIHKGKDGNIYQLDGIEKCIRLKESLEGDKHFKVINVNIKSEDNEKLAKSLILSTHSQKIIEAYKTGIPANLANSSGLMWQPKLYNFALESALCSKHVIDESLKNKISIALVGGGHHAERETPFGFCTVNTMAISAIYAASQNIKTLIIDLDTHYSNGCFDILLDKPNVKVLSLWNQTLEKWKYFKPQKNIWHKKTKTIQDYFKSMEELLEVARDFNPQLIIYHLGIDVLETDRMGGVKGMGEKEVLKRERLISKLFKNLDIPISIFIGGSYIDRSKGEAIAEKIKNNTTALLHQILRLYTE